MIAACVGPKAQWWLACVCRGGRARRAAGHTPIWPPAPFVRAIHWWAFGWDKLVLARPLWFRIAICLEILVQVLFVMSLSLFHLSRMF